MTDKEYREQKKRVQKYIDRWFIPMGLGWFKVDMVWDRATKEDAPSVAAEVYTQWQYRQASVHWYLPNLATVKDDELDDIVVHEFTHILINPLTLIDKSEDLPMQHEYATETIARAIQGARTAGEKDKAIYKHKPLML